MSKSKIFPSLRSQAEIDEEGYYNPEVAEFMAHLMRNLVLLAAAAIVAVMVADIIFPWIGGW